jgi:hypothetical protein
MEIIHIDVIVCENWLTFTGVPLLAVTFVFYLRDDGGSFSKFNSGPTSTQLFTVRFKLELVRKG